VLALEMFIISAKTSVQKEEKTELYLHIYIYIFMYLLASQWNLFQYIGSTFYGDSFYLRNFYSFYAVLRTNKTPKKEKKKKKWLEKKCGCLKERKFKLCDGCL